MSLDLINAPTLSLVFSNSKFGVLCSFTSLQPLNQNLACCFSASQMFHINIIGTIFSDMVIPLYSCNGHFSYSFDLRDSRNLIFSSCRCQLTVKHINNRTKSLASSLSTKKNGQKSPKLTNSLLLQSLLDVSLWDQIFNKAVNQLLLIHDRSLICIWCYVYPLITFYHILFFPPLPSLRPQDTIKVLINFFSTS